MAAYFNRKSSSALIIDLCTEGKMVALFSPSLIRELSHILNSIKVNKNFREKVKRLIDRSPSVKIRRRFSMIKEDPEDNKLLGCAYAGKADYLITADEHLLKLKEFLGIKIIKPSQFLKESGIERLTQLGN